MGLGSRSQSGCAPGLLRVRAVFRIVLGSHIARDGLGRRNEVGRLKAGFGLGRTKLDRAAIMVRGRGRVKVWVRVRRIWIGLQGSTRRRSGFGGN